MTDLSVVSCTVFRPLRSSSSVMLPSLSSSFSISLASRRAPRSATRASSAIFFTTLTSSCRRSCVSAGMGRRTSSPSDCGFRPSWPARIDFSISGISDLSHGLIVMRRASATFSDATWFSGVGVP